MGSHKIYFPNLNGLRFIAALLVIIHHIEQYKAFSHFENVWNPFVDVIGKLGVVLFFVLSGFLITFLLLTEEHRYHTISIRKFYMRRVLRIWPLYFLIVILAFFVLTNIDLFILPDFSKEAVQYNLPLKLFLYVFFLPNLVLSLYGMIPYVSHAWSIGTEEQFYLVWPVILKYFKGNRLVLMILIILFYLLIARLLSSPISNFIPNKGLLAAFWSTFNIDCMAIGGVFAILLFQKNILLKLLLNEYLFYITLLFTAGLILEGVYVPYFHYEFYSVLFGIIILNFAANQQIKISLENRVLNYLGNISYGIYMFHPIGIKLAIVSASALGLMTNWLIYPLAVSLTVIIAGLSYRYFESYFLRFKDKFSKVVSGGGMNHQ